jgi:hypothetical protein
MIANVGGTSQNWKKRKEKKSTQITTMLKKAFLL